MRLALALMGFIGLLGCAEGARPPPVEAPRILPPLAVKTIILRRVSEEWLNPTTPFVVVLTRPVDPRPNALDLVDDAGSLIEGETVWLDRQAVAFYPKQPLVLGLDLHLRLAVQLRATDGSTLEPRELTTGKTVTRVAKAFTSVGQIRPIDPIHLTVEEGRPLPPEEVEKLAILSGTNGPIPFVARTVGSNIEIVSKEALTPGSSPVFGWKAGPQTKTSVGRIELSPRRINVARGFLPYVGDFDDHCRRVSENDDRAWVCESVVAHIVFSAPVADAELKKHAHPSLIHATTGDLRGHRVEVSLKDKPIHIVFDAGLEDVFGQRLAHPVTFEIRRAD